MSRRKRDQPEMESWHRWRKQVKSLHYQIACLKDLLPARLVRLTKDTWKLQGLLGRHHDLYVTRQKVRRMRIDPINEPCRDRSIRVIDDELKRVEKRVKKLTREFLPATPKEFTAKLEQAALAKS
jgi:CHAD domain-containing protein